MNSVISYTQHPSWDRQDSHKPVAEKYPSARIIGTDISPIQPHWTPPNIEFRVEDLEDEYRPWTNIYKDADLIHIRAFLQTVRNPARIMERSFE